jgi:uncharacterized protein YneF (UPF0154 family)
MILLIYVVFLGGLVTGAYWLGRRQGEDKVTKRWWAWLNSLKT